MEALRQWSYVCRLDFRCVNLHNLHLPFYSPSSCYTLAGTTSKETTEIKLSQLMSLRRSSGAVRIPLAAQRSYVEFSKSLLSTNTASLYTCRGQYRDIGSLDASLNLSRRRWVHFNRPLVDLQEHASSDPSDRKKIFSRMKTSCM